MKRYGDAVFELEAIPPAKLQQLLSASIEGVLNMDAFRAELEAEKQDAAHLTAVRRRIITTLREAHEIVGESNSAE